MTCKRVFADQMGQYGGADLLSPTQPKLPSFEECKTGVTVSTELNRSHSNSFHGYGARLTCVQFSVLVWNALAKYFADGNYLKTHITEFKFA